MADVGAYTQSLREWSWWHFQFSPNGPVAIFLVTCVYDNVCFTQYPSKAEWEEFCGVMFPVLIPKIARERSLIFLAMDLRVFQWIVKLLWCEV